ncbi:phosphopantetheine-binding protein [Actinomadura madurae]|uniref:phosphopantetheine-binding protein n=1 Tax=Actinomadura madurae TaxID=1993 RepID=UPI00202652DE|nr:phosphopantetheine-binding protein [Actinomadura madurae]MCP9951125.1 phosphopantetheine-binding protein [Actinomadura madurae]MCP9967905.1 phosphopantetheine-binding protein [Actinomadura madurae]MCP9980360.1 phosphopantetheine-binding protein [Actinomadura madurae]MCQ0008122.1 phosphopantetheine-binding protein [Actinomadura madurae]MCQ0016570.1 phosphopantetheine-binding protein [Actinomadura madurae]
MDEATTAVADRLREVFRRCDVPPRGLAGAGPDTDLWDLGMDSFATIKVMVAIEEEFAIEFPDTMLTRETFRTLGSITAALETLLGAGDRV